MNESMDNTPPVSPTSDVYRSKMDFIRNPSRLASFLYLLGVSLMGVILEYITKNSFPSTEKLPLAFSLVVFMFIAGLVSAIIINFTTYILKTENRSFAKSITFSSAYFAIIFIIGFLTYTIKIPLLISFLLGFIIHVVLFGFIYQTKFLKSLGTYLLSMVFSAVLVVVFFILISLANFGLTSYFINSLINNNEVPITTVSDTLNQTNENQIPTSLNQDSKPSISDDNTSLNKDTKIISENNTSSSLLKSYSQPEGMFSVKYSQSFSLVEVPKKIYGNIIMPTSIYLNYFDMAGTDTINMSITPNDPLVSQNKTINENWNNLLQSKEGVYVKTKISGFDALSSINTELNGNNVKKYVITHIKTPTQIYLITANYSLSRQLMVDEVINNLIINN